MSEAQFTYLELILSKKTDLGAAELVQIDLVDTMKVRASLNKYS